MVHRENWNDELEHEKRGAALLLNRQRRDLLARITQESIESFSHHYKEMQKLNDLQKELDKKDGLPEAAPGQRWGDEGIAWADEILVLSASGKGWRATQVENVEKSSGSDPENIGDEMDMGGRGLKHRGSNE